MFLGGREIGACAVAADNRGAFACEERRAVMAIDRWLVLIVWAACAQAASPAVPDAEIVVHVAKDGPAILVDVDCPVQAPFPVVWEVLTDYDHMSTFISNLQQSTVESRDGNVLTVRQRGKASLGPFSVEFDGVRVVEILSFDEIRSHHVSGDLKSSEFTTRVIDIDGTLHVVNHGRYTPNRWVPPLIGPALIAAETRKQFDEIRREILRRSALPGAALPPRAANGSVGKLASDSRAAIRVGEIRLRDGMRPTRSRWYGLQA
jgi:hypothetical protein